MRPVDPRSASDEAEGGAKPARQSGRFVRLRRRFVALTMLAVVGVLVFVGLAVNVANSVATTSDLDHLLSLIYYSEANTTGSRGNSSSYLDDLDDWGNYDDLDDWEDLVDEGPKGFWERPLTQETSFATRWFSVRWQPGGSIAEVNLAHIASVSQADLPLYVAAATKAGPGYGWEGDFRYLVVQGQSLSEAIFLDASDEVHALSTLALLTVGVVVASTAAIFVLVWALSGWVVRPFAEADERQRRFVTDASHELKTPLAVILASLGVLKMDVGENRWIEKADTSAQRMGELVDELVTLSRLDEKGEREKTTFDASLAVSDVAQGFADVAEAKGHELVLRIAPELTYTGDAAGLRQIVSVLLDNAVKYTLPGGPIMLTLERSRRKGLRLMAENPAEPMDAEALAHLFDRFWRPDTSRTRESGGFGIGLSIARELAESAGGNISATQDAAGLLRFELTLP